MGEARTNRLPVVHVVPAIFSSDGILGGGERYAFELARNMASVTPTVLVSFGQKTSEMKYGGLTVRTLGNPTFVRGSRTNPITASLRRELRAAGVVHCHQQHIIASSLSAAFCRLTGRKVFVSDLGGGGWDISGYISTDRWYHGHLHISRYSRYVSGHEGKPWAHVIYGGVDTDKFCPGDSPDRESTVLFVGRLLPHKGVNYLIQALPPGLHLEIIGQPYDERYIADLRILAAGKNVTFRFDCRDQDLIAAYRRAMCVVLPSVYRTMYGEETRVPELLGQTLLEAMACATPVICTDVASMPEIVRHGVTGFVVPPNDPGALGEKLCWFRDHPDPCDNMGKAARIEVLQRFTWPTVVQRCLDIYFGRKRLE